jgi:hypothetical protein
MATQTHSRLATHIARGNVTLPNIPPVFAPPPAPIRPPIPPTCPPIPGGGGGGQAVSNTYLLTLLMDTPYSYRALITPFVEPIALSG